MQFLIVTETFTALSLLERFIALARQSWEKRKCRNAATMQNPAHKTFSLKGISQRSDLRGSESVWTKGYLYNESFHLSVSL